MTNPKELYTHSRIASFRACPRKSYYAYERMIRAKKPAAPFVFGSAWHAALEFYWEARRLGVLSPEERIDRAHKRANGLSQRPETFEDQKLHALLDAYCVLWDAWPVEVLAIEQTFRVPLRHPDTHEEHPRAQLGGQMDLVLRSMRTGRVAINEHKSTSQDVSPGSDYVFRLAMDGQIGLYFHAGEILGYGAVDVIYDVAKKPAIRPRHAKKETPEQFGDRVREAIAADPKQYIRRLSIARPEGEQREVWRDIWSWVGKIEKAAEEGDWPRNPDNCFKWGSTCEYFAVCSGRADIEDPVLFIKAGKHVELRGQEHDESDLDLGF